MHHINEQRCFLMVLSALAFLLMLTPSAAYTAEDDALMRYETMVDTFLQASDFPNALKAIRMGLAHDPTYQPLRLRLARLYEWMGNPTAAYKIWKDLAASGNAEAKAAVIRLAQSVGDSATHLAVLQQAVVSGGMNAAAMKDLIHAYEYYGMVDDGVAFFQGLYRSSGNPDALASLIVLYEQQGNIFEAIRMHREHLERFGFDPERSVRLAELLFSQGQWKEAYNELQRIAGQSMMPSSHRFWDLYASLAWELQRAAEAEQAYRVLLSRKEFAIESAERLGFLIFRRSPLEAAHAMMQLYQRKPDVRLLTIGLQYFISARAFHDAQKAIEKLSADTRAEYEKNNAYIMAAGLVASGLRKHDEALRLYRQVLQRSPADLTVREAILWTLIEQKNLTILARAVAAWQDELKSAGRYHLVLASAYAALNRFSEALRYYDRSVRTVSDDISLRLIYADMFESISREDIQTRLKSDLFRTVMRDYQTGKLKPDTPENNSLLGQLALAFLPNNKLAGYFEQIRKRNESLPCPDYSSYELWLTWAINTGHEEAALRMMRKWEASFRQDAHPLWSRLLLALRQKDIDAAGSTVLEHDYRLLPRADRIDAARDARQYRLAQEMAFESLEVPFNDHDHESHERFVSLTTQQYNQADVRLRYINRDTVHSAEAWSAYLFRMVNDWWLQPWISTSRLTIKSTDLYIPAHVTDQRMGVYLLKKSPQVDLDLNVYARDAWKSFVATEFSLVRRYNEAFSFGAELGRNAPSDVSEPLIIAGMRDYARADVTYAFSSREFLNTALTAERLMLQDRSVLGSAMRYELSLGHRIRIEYPDITVRIPMQYYKTWIKNTMPLSAATLLKDTEAVASDFFVPKSSKQVGMGIDYGILAREQYSKDWRPFFSAEYVYNDINLSSGTFSAGIVGSISGRDRLVMSAERGVGKGFATPASQVEVRYTIYF